MVGLCYAAGEPFQLVIGIAVIVIPGARPPKLVGNVPVIVFTGAALVVIKDQRKQRAGAWRLPVSRARVAFALLASPTDSRLKGRLYSSLLLKIIISNQNAV
jgi:hypothetical protein